MRVDDDRAPARAGAVGARRPRRRGDPWRATCAQLKHGAPARRRRPDDSALRHSFGHVRGGGAPTTRQRADFGATGLYLGGAADHRLHRPPPWRLRAASCCGARGPRCARGDHGGVEARTRIASRCALGACAACSSCSTRCARAWPSTSSCSSSSSSPTCRPAASSSAAAGAEGRLPRDDARAARLARSCVAWPPAISTDRRFRSRSPLLVIAGSRRRRRRWRDGPLCGLPRSSPRGACCDALLFASTRGRPCAAPRRRRGLGACVVRGAAEARSGFWAATTRLSKVLCGAQCALRCGRALALPRAGGVGYAHVDGASDGECDGDRADTVTWKPAARWARARPRASRDYDAPLSDHSRTASAPRVALPGIDIRRPPPKPMGGDGR